MSALQLELRRGSGAPLFALLVALGLIGAWRSVEVPPAIWPLVVSSLGNAVMLMGPVAGGLATFAATRSRRRRTSYLENGSSRGPAAAALVELAALLLWTAAAYLALVAVLFGYAATSATWSSPDILRTVAVGAGLLLYPVLGHLVGRLLPRRFAPLVVAVALYAVAVLLGSRGGRFSQFLPVDLSLYDEFNVLNDRVAPGQLLWYVGAGGALTGAWAWGRQRTATWAAVLGGGLVLAALGAVILLPQQGRSIVGGAVRTKWTCTSSLTSDGQPASSVCLHPALSALAPQVTAELLPIAQRLSGTPFQVRRFEQRPRGVGSVPTPGATAFALDDGRQSSLRLLRPSTAVNALGVQDSCYTQAGAERPGAPYDQLVAAWVAGQPDLFVPLDDEQKRAQEAFSRLDVDQVRSWLTLHEDAVRRCAVAGADLQ